MARSQFTHRLSTISVTSIAALGLGLASRQAVAQTVLSQQSTQFARSGVPIWSSPNAGHNAGYTLLGPTWNLADTSLGSIYDLEIEHIGDLGKTGVKTTFGGTGLVGFKVKPWIDGGQMDFTYNAGVTVTTSNALPSRGDAVTVSWAFYGLPGSSFTTTSPAFGLGFKGNFHVTGHANYEAWFLGKQLGSGNVFAPFSIGKTGDYEISSKIPGSHDDGVVDLTGTAVQQLLSLLSTGASLAETNALPDPVAFSLSIPDLSTSAAALNADSSLSATTFGTFLNLNTDFLTLVGLLVGDPAILTNFLSGNYQITGTNLTVSWDIARLYADMNYGFNENIVLTPQPIVTAALYNDIDGVLTPIVPTKSTSSSATFNYPAAGTVRVVPTVRMGFMMSNNFGWGIGGDIGMIPIDFTLTGSVGSGANAQTYNVSAKPANEQWTGPNSIGLIAQDKTSIDCGATTLQPASYFPVDNYNLPTQLTVVGGSGSGAVVHAFATDPDKDYYTLQVVPKQGTQFFIGRGFSASATIDGPGITNRSLGLNATDNGSGGIISMQVPGAQTLLQPGTFSVSLHIQATTRDGKSHKTTYQIPVYSVHETPKFSSQLYAGPDLERTVNRCPVDGQDHTFWLSLTSGVYGDTDVVLDAKYSLPLFNAAGKPLGSQRGPYTLAGFRVPKGLAANLGGGTHSFQLRNVNIAPSSSGKFGSPNISTGVALPFLAAPTSVSDILVESRSQKVNPIIPDGRDHFVTLRGTGFSPRTFVRCGVVNGVALPSGNLDTVFVNPQVMRVRIPDKALVAAQFANINLPLQLTAPGFTVPADSMSPKATGGGDATATLIVSDPTPYISKFAIAPFPDGGNAEIQIYGSNLLRSATTHQPFTTVLVQGVPIATKDVALDPANPPTWIKFYVPGQKMVAGATEIVLRNGSVRSTPIQAPIVHVAPTLTEVTVGSALKTKVAGQVNLLLTGTHFYSDSYVTVNGQRSMSPARVSSSTGLTAYFPYSASAHGAKVTVQVVNPYGGESKALTLIWP